MGLGPASHNRRPVNYNSSPEHAFPGLFVNMISETRKTTRQDCRKESGAVCVGVRVGGVPSGHTHLFEGSFSYFVYISKKSASCQSTLSVCVCVWCMCVCVCVCVDKCVCAEVLAKCYA